MAPRLLSFLSKIETALIEQGCASASSRVQRSVSYHKGLARLSFADGGSISLQSFTLADGQVCLKAALLWPGRDEAVVHAIYPHGDQHDWKASAEAVASVWMSGPESALPMRAADAAPRGLDRLVAVG